MGSFVVYIIEWALCLSAFLLLFKMCFSGCTFHRFNRFFLLGSVAVSAFLPLIHVPSNEQIEPIAEVLRLKTEQLETLSMASYPQTTIAEVQDQLSTGQKVFVIVALTYLLYIAIQVIGWVKSLVKMGLMLRGKRKRSVGRWVRLVVHGEAYGPFSWMNYIFISEQEDGFCRRASIRHEMSHIKLLHPADLVFIMLCTLVNPLCWIVMKEIKVVHEYEADDEVINYYHIHSRDYQRLLVRRTVGAEAYALACSFNINIKKRIMMMKKKQSHWWRITWIAVTIPLVGIALTAFSKPKEALKEVVDSSVRIIQQPIANLLDTDANEQELMPATPTSIEETVATVDDLASGEETDMGEASAMPSPSSENTAEPLQDVKQGDPISGRIIDENGKPVMMAVVLERDEYGRIYANSMSDKNGNFVLRLTNPKHQVSVMCPGYETQILDIKEPSLTVVLKHNAKLSGVTVSSQAESIDPDAPYYKEENRSANESDQVFEIIHQMPDFPGGDQELTKYLSTHLHYPALAKEMQVEGEVTVEFIIDKTGLVRSPKVTEVNAASPLVTADIQKAAKEGNEQALDAVAAYDDAIEAMKEEAIHVVRNIPRWEPSRRNGIRFDMVMSLPVRFKIVK